MHILDWGANPFFHAGFIPRAILVGVLLHDGRWSIKNRLADIFVDGDQATCERDFAAETSQCGHEVVCFVARQRKGEKAQGDRRFLNEIKLGHQICGWIASIGFVAGINVISKSPLTGIENDHDMGAPIAGHQLTQLVAAEHHGAHLGAVGGLYAHATEIRTEQQCGAVDNQNFRDGIHDGLCRF